jgi:hypothetical protein
VTYQSIRMTSGARADQWVVDGELVAGHEIVAARSVLNYHGVYRSGPGALAWLGWRLASSGIRGARAAGTRWALAADLNADAPGGLATARASAG